MAAIYRNRDKTTKKCRGWTTSLPVLGDDRRRARLPCEQRQTWASWQNPFFRGPVSVSASWASRETGPRGGMQLYLEEVLTVNQVSRTGGGAECI
ncbi:hypothetical protein IAQ61_009542 [Plenodomus lingam]|uniref:uncharacterized protein n=1 Tax=Leptosphaeria maculans TaxID=5022 RepID=UPI003316CFA3|nr:hypothetical protein IAQ61_009542 [Plenodomus lingam]